MSTKKPNCYECIHRRNIPGDAHSRCGHPEIGVGDFVDAIVALMDGRAQRAAGKLNIMANQHGVRSGWFMWPANFDPCWLEACDGFTKSDKT